jgi:hypothetical protein
MMRLSCPGLSQRFWRSAPTPGQLFPLLQDCCTLERNHSQHARLEGRQTPIQLERKP